MDAAEQNRQARQYALQAVALLATARAAGYFQNPTALEDIKKNRDFAFLRSREDFQKLVTELAETQRAGGR